LTNNYLMTIGQQCN